MSRPLTVLRRGVRSLAVLATGVSLVAASALAHADGIDISHWQGTVSWSQVDGAGISFAFMKATEGTTYADPTLRANWDGAQAQGIYRSAYHFARPSTASGSAAAQAAFFVRTVGSFQDPGDLPPVLDLEATGGLGVAALRTWTATWLATVEQLTGRTPIIYVSPSFWESNLGNSTAFQHYPLWVAHYGVTSPRVPGGWPTWTFWQRTSSGSVPGIGGRVDLNAFNGSSAALALLANTTGGTSSPVATGPTVPTGAPTSLALTPARVAANIDQRVHFRGQLAVTSPSAPVAARPVTVWALPLGSATWSQVGAGTTDASGLYDVQVPVPGTADYQVHWAGDATFAAVASPVVRVTTPPRTATSVSLPRKRVHVAKGRSVTLTGTFRTPKGGAAGMLVRYYKRSTRAGAPWIYVGKDLTGRHGVHRLVVHPRLTRQWQAVYTGSHHFVASSSSVITVRPR